MFSDVWDSILGFFGSILEFFYNIFVPIFGEHSWGWAIIALTLLVRIIILPLAVKQFRSMRAMQALQPQLKALQKKYKVDRELMRKDPEQYRAKRQKLNEEMMALYQREGASPAASCLPMLAQAPIFIALFWTIRGQEELAGAPFYFFTNFISADADAQGLAALVTQTGWPGWLLIVLMSGTMFLTQKQMMARNAATQAPDGASTMGQQQKILLYVMPLFLAFISLQFPLGLLLYWCTTNLWQVAQQSIILREVKHEAETGELENKPGGESLKRFRRRRDKTNDVDGPDTASRKRSPGASSGEKSALTDKDGGSTEHRGSPSKPTSKDGTDTSTPSSSAGANGAGADDRKGKHVGKPKGDRPSGGAADSTGGLDGSDSPAKRRKRDHLPRRGGSGRSSSGGNRS